MVIVILILLQRLNTGMIYFQKSIGGIFLALAGARPTSAGWTGLPPPNLNVSTDLLSTETFWLIDVISGHLGLFTAVICRSIGQEINFIGMNYFALRPGRLLQDLRQPTFCPASVQGP